MIATTQEIEFETVRLTKQVKAGGCASKLPPGSLRTVLSHLPEQRSENLIVGFDTSDDAGVFGLSDKQALVQTVDFFTPMVDDPFTYGRVAATNALSDVYAMGGSAITALALVCFPQDGDLRILEEIMRGGLSTMQEAGCVVVGGHSVRDNEIKFGYAVTGLIHPQRVFTNSGARPGDRLILTKALGTGVITTALKQDKAASEWVEGAVRSMTTSNRLASEIAIDPQYEVHAMTDVTGFGLMGHAREMAFASSASLKIDVHAVPVMAGARDCIGFGSIPGGLVSNREFAECVVLYESVDLPSDLVQLMYDPQTSGGLLIAVAQKSAEPLAERLRSANCFGAIIGEVAEGKPGIVLS